VDRAGECGFWRVLLTRGEGEVMKTLGRVMAWLIRSALTVVGTLVALAVIMVVLVTCDDIMYPKAPADSFGHFMTSVYAAELTYGELRGAVPA
jgi:hypothetical protein